VGKYLSYQQDVKPYYMTMEHYDLSFNAWIMKEHVPLEVLRYQFYMIAHAIGSCHLLGIAHNDIKPENIALDEYLVPHLIDFGLAYIDGYS
jgi:serine/threonine protein kinase